MKYLGLPLDEQDLAKVEELKIFFKEKTNSKVIRKAISFTHKKLCE